MLKPRRRRPRTEGIAADRRPRPKDAASAEVNVPTREDEAVRDYLRMYEQVKTDLKRAKQRLLHFLHRRGVKYTERNNWTERHRRWLRALELDNALDCRTLEEYYACVVTLEEKCQRLQAQVEEIAL